MRKHFSNTFDILMEGEKMSKDFEEVLIVGEDKVYLRKCYRPGDIYNLFPRGEYEEREATKEDIKRVAPSLYELGQKRNAGDKND